MFTPAATGSDTVDSEAILGSNPDDKEDGDEAIRDSNLELEAIRGSNPEEDDDEAIRGSNPDDKEDGDEGIPTWGRGSKGYGRTFASSKQIPFAKLDDAKTPESF